MSNIGIQNLKTYDAFNDTGEDGQHSRVINSKIIIHIRVQTRSAKKYITIVEGLPDDFDLKKILRFIKQKYACNGNITKDENNREIIQLQGDQRNNVRNFLADNLGVGKENIMLHGF